MAQGTQIAQAYVQIIPTTEGITNGIKESIEDSMKGVESAGDDAAQSMGKSMGKIIDGAIYAGITAATAKGMKLIKESIDLSAQYEQLKGGTEKIFAGMDTSRIYEDAKAAYKDLGMSANEYLESVNQIGSQMKASLGSEGAYETARKGMKAVSDYANGLGKDVGTLTEKYQALNRGTASYQSLADNFSGILPQTSADFLKQAQAAGDLSESYKSLSEVPVAEYQEALANALERGNEQLGLAGTTAQEANSTISGSINQMKKAWENLINSLTNPDFDTTEMAQKFVESIKSVIENIGPAIEELGPSLEEAFEELFSELEPMIADLLARAIVSAIRKLPDLYKREMERMFKQANASLDVGSPFEKLNFELSKTARALEQISGINPFSGGLLGQIKGLFTIFKQLGDVIDSIDWDSIGRGLSEAFPVADEWNNFINRMSEGWNRFKQRASEALESIKQGLSQAFPVAQQWNDWMSRLGNGWDNLKSSASEAFSQLKQNISSALNGMSDAVKSWGSSIINNVRDTFNNLANKIVETIRTLPQKVKQAGAEMAQGLVNGFTEKMNAINTKVVNTVEKLVNAIKNALEIHSPSRLMKREVGEMMAKGLEVGWSEEMARVNAGIDADIQREFAISKNTVINSASKAPNTSRLNTNGLVNEIVKAMQNVTVNNTVTLEGDAGKLFTAMQSQNRTYKNSTGRSAFA